MTCVPESASLLLISPYALPLWRPGCSRAHSRPPAHQLRSHSPALLASFFSQYFEDKWAIVFSHPKDYTPVCTTELGEAAKLSGEFGARGVKMIALSCDSVEDHLGWKKDIVAVGGAEVTYPIIADTGRDVAALLGMLDDDEKDDKGLPVTVRKVFIIGPDRKIKAALSYPTVAGRYFPEILRLIDALQLGAKFPIATPVGWTPGQDVMIQPSLPDAEAEKLFPGFRKVGVPSGKNYVRMTADPSRK